MRQLGAALFAVGAAGHGYITEPPSRTGATYAGAGTCPYGSCLWFNQGCTIGCNKCAGVAGGQTSHCPEQGTATLPMEARTYNLNSKSCGTNPWCAPGSSPMFDPCGIAGGDVVHGSAGNGGIPPPGYEQGHPGSAMPEIADVTRTWKVGDIVDVAWAVDANHGGGYQYRLCPKPAAGSNVTEECFQKTPLEFVGEDGGPPTQQWIQYCTIESYAKALSVSAQTPAQLPPGKAWPSCDLTNRTAIPAVSVSTGTIPAGSIWMRNPIPACKALAGGAFNEKCGSTNGASPSDYQFPPAGPDLARPAGSFGGDFPQLLGGFGSGACGVIPCTRTGDGYMRHLQQFSIVDKVKVPRVPPGDYVVSFRWDCEQTPQIWSQCSDVHITA